MVSEKLIEFKRVCEELSEVYVSKNEEYGDSFGQMFDEDGVKPCLYQIKHKLNRALQIADKDDVVYESLEDTLRDLANYSIMTYMEYRLSNKPKVKFDDCNGDSISGNSLSDFNEAFERFVTNEAGNDTEKDESSEILKQLKTSLIPKLLNIIDEEEDEDAKMMRKVCDDLYNAKTVEELFNSLTNDMEEMMNSDSYKDLSLCERQSLESIIEGVTAFGEMIILAERVGAI